MSKRAQLHRQGAEGSFAARYSAAYAAFLAGRLDDALALLAGCEHWAVPHGADGVLLIGTALSWRDPLAASALLEQHRALCEDARPVEFHALLGRCRSLQNDSDGAHASFARARAVLRGSNASVASLDFEEARSRLLLGRSDPHCPQMIGAFADPSARAQACAYHFRAGMHEALGDYRAQIADLSASLRIVLAHPSECEMLGAVNAVKHLCRTALEVNDRAAMLLAREVFERLPLLPDTRSDYYAILDTFASHASLQGDSLGAQRLLRRSEEVAVKAVQRISAYVARASVAHQAGSELWAAEEFSHAIELAQRVDWERASAEDCSVLSEIARIAAEIDIDVALEYFNRYKVLRAKHPGPHPYDERRIQGFDLAREGVIRARAGENAAARALLEGAYAIWAPIDHHVRAGLVAAELYTLTGEARWETAFQRHALACEAKGWLPVAKATQPEPERKAGARGPQQQFETARRNFLAGEIDAARVALDGCESWSDPVAADAMVLHTTLLARRRQVDEVEGFLLHAGLRLRELRPTAYYATLGLCQAARRDSRGSALNFKRAREFEQAAAPAQRVQLAYAIALGRYYCGKADPGSAEIRLALQSTVPSERQSAFYLRANMYMWLGDYRAQVRDLHSALELAQEHPYECEIAMTTRIARDLYGAGMELWDEAALRAGRAAIETLAPAPNAMGDQVEARMGFAMTAFLAGDPGLGQRILRETEEWAVDDASRVALHGRRAYIATLNGNALWASEELTLGMERAKAINWDAQSAVGILALMEIARALAEAHSPLALEFLAHYERLHARVGGLPHVDTRRYTGFLQWAQGLIRARMGEKEAAMSLLEESSRVFAPIDHHLRAALAARELYGLTNAKRWRDALFRHAQACNAKAWCVAPDFAGESDDDYASLTPTQREIFRAICDGLTVTEVAPESSRSVFTINKHLQAVYTTFNVHSRAQLRAEAKARALI